MRPPRRVLVVLGVALYGLLLAVVLFGVVQGDQGVAASGGRIRGATSNIGMLATLVIAAPAVIWWAIADWKKRP